MDTVQGRRHFNSSAFLTAAFVFFAAAAVVGVAGSVIMESPVMVHGMAAENAGRAAGDFWLFAEESDLRAIRSIINERSRGLSPEVTDALAEAILVESIRHELDPALILAIIETESSFRNWSRSTRNAVGLMQILPSTGEAVARKIDIQWEGEASLYLPLVNVRLGTYYFKELVERFESIELALAAYNRGPNAVMRMIGRGLLPPQRYSRKVLSSYGELRLRFTPRAS